MMYDDLRMAGYSHHSQSLQQQEQESLYRSQISQQAQMSLWDCNSGGGWKMEPCSPPSPPPVHSPFVDLDTDSWFQDGGSGDYNSLAAASANVHNQQNSIDHHHHNHHYSTCSSPDLIVPDTSDALHQHRFGDVTTGHVVVEHEDAKPPTRAEAAQKLLNDLDEWIKEEPFSDWYEEKIDLPIFEELETVQPPQPVAPLVTRRSDVPAALLCHQATRLAGHQFKMAATPSAPTTHHQHQPIPVALIGGAQQAPANHVPVAVMGQQQPQSLMQEFDFVLDNHQQHHHHQDEMLTPPESPSARGGAGAVAEPGVEGLTMLQNMPTEELDELVRIRVESLVEGGEDSSQCSYSQGEEECSSSEEGEGEGSASSPAPSLDSGYEDRDPEWSPQQEETATTTAKSGGGQHKRRRQSGGGGGKPYSRPPPEEKRQRKKEQNKNAATRYRLKKKAEIEEILGEERQLQDKNHELKTDVGELEREIKYLKSLMREVFRAKGLIK